MREFRFTFAFRAANMGVMGTEKDLSALQEARNSAEETARTLETGGGADPGAQHVRNAGGRYQARSDAIIAAAIPVLNGLGLKGMRLADVAQSVGLKTTAITYYFPKKEDLALACIEHGLDVFHAFLTAAETEATPVERVRRLIFEFVMWDVAVRRGEAVPLASFHVIRALDDAHREQAAGKYRQMFLRTRRLLGGANDSEAARQFNSIRTLILLEQLYWAAEWLSEYEIEDAPRLAERICDVLLSGLSAGAGEIEADRNAIGPPDSSPANEDFIRAATREINRLGYRGASIDRISAQLNVTKGAFYHWHDAKDQLVRACYCRTFDLIKQAQRADQGGDMGEWGRLAGAVASLIAFQLSEEGPLMRTSAIHSLPADLQNEVRELSDRTRRTFSSMISDAIAEGAARPVNSSIAADMLAAGIDAAADVSMWPTSREKVNAQAYARVLLFGLIET